MPASPAPRVRKRVPKDRVYESEAPLQQKYFPHRRKIARVCRDWEKKTIARERAHKRAAARFESQQTLTQIDFVHMNAGARDGDDAEGQSCEEDGQGEEWEESRPAKRRKKANPRRIPKLAGQETLTQLDFVKRMHKPDSDGAEYNVWLEEPAGDVEEQDSRQGIKIEREEGNGRSLEEIASPTSMPLAGDDASKRIRSTRKKRQRQGPTPVSPITVPARISANHDSATRSPLSDISPNKPSSRTSPAKAKNKAFRKSPRKKRIPAIRESLSPQTTQVHKRKQILAIANSDSEDPDENSDNDDTFRLDDTPVIIRLPGYRPYSTYKDRPLETRNHARTSPSLQPQKSAYTVGRGYPTTDAKAFTHDEILDSESARAISSQAPYDAIAEDNSPITQETLCSANGLSITNQANELSAPICTKQNQSEHAKRTSSSSSSLPTSPSVSPPTCQTVPKQIQKQKPPQKQDLEQSQSILPTPLSQATTVDPDSSNAAPQPQPSSSPSSARSRRSIQPAPSSLRQKSSPEHQQGSAKLASPNNDNNANNNNQAILISSDGLEEQTNTTNESFVHRRTFDDNGTFDLDDDDHDDDDDDDVDDDDDDDDIVVNEGSYSIPSSPTGVITAENLLPESLMAFSIPRPPSLPHML